MAHDIFISYSTVDKTIANALCANLEKAGFRCWIAPRDIAPGMDWPTAVSTAIAESRMMVLVFSVHSNSSDMVGRELNLAVNNKLIVIPFKIDDTTPDKAKGFFLAGTHWLDAMNPPTQKQIDELVGHAIQFLGEPAGHSPEAEPEKNEPIRHKRTGRGKFFWIGAAALVLAGVAGGLILLHPFAPKPAPTNTPTLAPPTPTPTARPTLTLTPTLPPVSSGKVVISALVYNGSGSQEPDEYVEIRNEDTRAIQMQGWTLEDSSGHVYRFPGFEMQPGQACRIYTNEAHPEACGFNFESGVAIWANSGDCAYLKDSLSTLIAEHCY